MPVQSYKTTQNTTRPLLNNHLCYPHHLSGNTDASVFPEPLMAVSATAKMLFTYEWRWGCWARVVLAWSGACCVYALQCNAGVQQDMLWAAPNLINSPLESLNAVRGISSFQLCTCSIDYALNRWSCQGVLVIHLSTVLIIQRSPRPIWVYLAFSSSNSIAS